MAKWTRWQDWIAVIAGLYAALATIWTVQTTASLPLMIVFGVVLVLVGLTSLALPSWTAVEWLAAVVAALLFASPWMGAYAKYAGAAWTSWICGAIGVIVTLAAITRTRESGPSVGMPPPAA